MGARASFDNRWHIEKWNDGHYMVCTGHGQNRIVKGPYNTRTQAQEAIFMLSKQDEAGIEVYGNGGTEFKI